MENKYGSCFWRNAGQRSLDHIYPSNQELQHKDLELFQEHLASLFQLKNNKTEKILKFYSRKLIKKDMLQL